MYRLWAARVKSMALLVVGVAAPSACTRGGSWCWVSVLIRLFPGSLAMFRRQAACLCSLHPRAARLFVVQHVRACMSRMCQPAASGASRLALFVMLLAQNIFRASRGMP